MGQLTSNEWINLRVHLQQFRQITREVVNLVQKGNPATELLATLAEMICENKKLLAVVVAQECANRTPLPRETEKALAESQELLEDSIHQLQSAERYAKVSLQEIVDQLQDVAQGQKVARAYQSSRENRNDEPGSRPSHRLTNREAIVGDDSLNARDRESGQ
jgi:hypothetical protein